MKINVGTIGHVDYNNPKPFNYSKVAIALLIGGYTGYDVSTKGRYVQDVQQKAPRLFTPKLSVDATA